MYVWSDRWLNEFLVQESVSPVAKTRHDTLGLASHGTKLVKWGGGGEIGEFQTLGALRALENILW